MLVTCDSDVFSIGAILVGQLDLDVMVISDLVDGGPFLSDDVRVVPRLNLEGDGEAAKSLWREAGKKTEDTSIGIEAMFLNVKGGKKITKKKKQQKQNLFHVSLFGQPVIVWRTALHGSSSE